MSVFGRWLAGCFSRATLARWPVSVQLGIALAATGISSAADSAKSVPAQPAGLPVEAVIVTNTFAALPVRRSAYVMRAWESEEGGLPQNDLNSITQTRDGYLWCGTFNGLARFDGTTFKVFDAANTPELKSSRIVRVYTDRKDRLWILAESGEITSYIGGKFVAYGAAAGVPPNGLRSIMEDANGILWAGARFHEGLFQFDGGRFAAATNGASFAFGSVFELAAAGDGTLWGLQPLPGDPEGLMFRLRPGDPVRVEPSPGKGHLPVIGIAGSPTGGIWVSTRMGLHDYRSGRCERILACPEPLRSVAKICEDRRGNIWVGTFAQGLFQFDQKGAVRRLDFDETNHPKQVNCVFEDREGSIWVGLAGGGLRQLRARVFATYDNRDGLADDDVQSVSEDFDGSILAVTRNKVERLSGNRIGDAIDPGLVKFPRTALAGRDGELWIASTGSGLYRYSGGRAEQFLAPFENRFFGPRAWGLYLSHDQEPFLAARDGLYTVDGKCLHAQSPLAGPITYDVRAIAEDHHHTLYAGLNGDGLLVRANGEWRRLTVTNGLAGGDVWSLYVDRDDVLWVGTMGHGLGRLKNGHCFNFAAAALPRVVNCILEDDQDQIWLGSNQGIYRVARRQLNDLADGHATEVLPTRYGALDGLGSGECSAGNQPGAWKARDGRLWFATAKGISVVDPTALPPIPVPPPALLEDVLIDDHMIPIPTGTNVSVTVPPGNRRLEIHYSAPSFATPGNNRFRYQLAGLDQEWTDVGSRHAAYFQGLAPGQYHFQVAAGNCDGIWSPSLAGLEFTVQPFFWQTATFRLFAALIVVGLISLGFQRRIADLQRRRFAQQEFSRKLIDSQESERKRIAGELHDSLGQKLQLIHNYAMRALQRGIASGAEADPLRDISGVTREAITEVRAITHALRPAELDQVGLTRALEWMVESVGKASGLAVLAEIDPIDHLLPPEGEMNLYRVVQESLNNVIKHAQATAVTVEIKRSGDRLGVTIFDNGRGFVVPAAGAVSAERRGLGLAGIGERVRILGGGHHLHSNLGKGTRLVVTIPLTGV